MTIAFRLFTLVLALTLPTAAATAADPAVEALERKLNERDRLIDDLRQRVDLLERRLGIDPSSGPATVGTTATKESCAHQHAARTAEAPGTVVVEDGEAERALERSLTQVGALLLPAGILEVQPSLLYERQEADTPTFVISGGSTLAGQSERSGDSLTADMSLRLGLPFDSQLELGLPYRWRSIETVTNVGFVPVDSSTNTGTGLGDLRVGFAKTLFREGLWRPDLVGRITWNTATGAKTDGNVPLGGGFNELRGALTAIKRQDPIAFVGSLSYEHVFEDDAVRPGTTIAANLGGFIALSPETSLRLLLAAAYQDETKISGQTIAGSDRTLGTFVIGGSTLLGRGLFLNVSAGIGLTNDADDFTVSISLPIRFSTPFF